MEQIFSGSFILVYLPVSFPKRLASWAKIKVPKKPGKKWWILCFSWMNRICLQYMQTFNATGTSSHEPWQTVLLPPFSSILCFCFLWNGWSAFCQAWSSSCLSLSKMPCCKGRAHYQPRLSSKESNSIKRIHQHSTASWSFKNSGKEQIIFLHIFLLQWSANFL